MSGGGSLLETFFIMFDSDADKVDKGAKKAEKSTDDLEKKLNAADRVSGKLGGSFLSMAKAAAGALAAVLSVGAVMRGVFASAEVADRLNETSESLGISVEELSVWGDAAKLAGGSSEGLNASLATLSTSFVQLATTGKSRAKPFFDELGISMKDSTGKVRDVIDVLPELAAKFEKMSKQESLGFGRKLGLDEGTIKLLQKGGKEVDDMIRRQKELGVITKADAEIADKYHDALDDMSHAFRSIFLQLGSVVLPALTSFIKLVTDGAVWMREHKHVVSGFFIGAAIAITTYYLPAMIAAAAATLAATWPILLIIAVIALLSAAFALVYDDVMNFLEGNASVLGSLVDLWSSFVDALGDMLLGWRDLVIGIWDEVVSYIMGAINSITGGIKSALEFVGLAHDTTHEAIMSGQVQVATANNAPIASQTSGSIGAAKSGNITKQNTVRIEKVEVQTQATDAQGIASGIGKGLHKEMSQAANNFDDGVAR